MIEAQELLMQTKASSFAYMNPGERNKFHRELYKLAYPSAFKDAVSIEDFAKKIGGKA